MHVAKETVFRHSCYWNFMQMACALAHADEDAHAQGQSWALPAFFHFFQ